MDLLTNRRYCMNNESLNQKSKVFFVPDADEPNQRYIICPSSLARDQEISPNCIALLIYLSSHAPNWRINIKQLCNHYKKFLGRDKIYSLIKEAIKAGYMKKEERLENNLRRTFYILSVEGKFKKSFPRPENQEVENSNNIYTNSNNFSDVLKSSTPRIPTLKYYQEEDSSSSCACAYEADASMAPPTLLEPPPNPKIQKIVQALQEFLPFAQYSPQEFEEMAKAIWKQANYTDDIEIICSSIKWGALTSFWRPKLTSKKTLIKHFKTIFAQFLATEGTNTEEFNKLKAKNTLIRIKNQLKVSSKEEDIKILKKAVSNLKIMKNCILDLASEGRVYFKEKEKEFEKQLEVLLKINGIVV